MLDFRRGLATFVLTIVGFGAGAIVTTAASAQTVNPNPNVPLRGERASRYDIRNVERRIHRSIVQLQHDRRDYGGHRVNAINLLNQAEGELNAAIQYDNAHPN